VLYSASPARICPQQSSPEGSFEDLIEMLQKDTEDADVRATFLLGNAEACVVNPEAMFTAAYWGEDSCPTSYVDALVGFSIAPIPSR